MKSSTTNLKRNWIGLCVMLVGSATVYACSLAWLPIYSGVGEFDDKKPSVREMGDTAFYLAGAFSDDMVVQWDAYSASCQPLSYSFWGTTTEGYEFWGLGDPNGGKGRKRKGGAGNNITLTVTYIEVYDPLFDILVDDDGGFKVQFTADGPAF